MISKEILGQIIMDWQAAEIPSLINRDLKVDLEMPLKRAIAIIGPRRSGKTFFLYSLIKGLLDSSVVKQQLLYVNFEQPKLLNIDTNDLDNLLSTFYEIFPDNLDREVWLFFDEIQNVQNWEIWVRHILDTKKIRLIISGSSAKLLSKEIATSLRGRTITYTLLPFSFAEYLRAKKFTFTKYLSTSKKILLTRFLTDYLCYGGYPEVILYQKEWEKIINEIMEVTILRDLIERHKIRNFKVVKLLFNHLVSAKEFSTHKFYRTLKSMGITTSKNSLYNFMEYFQDAFIFFPLHKFAWSLANVSQTLPKVYAVDNSFFTMLGLADKGRQLENTIFLELLRRGYVPNKNLFYLQTSKNKEVDFIIKKGKKIEQMIQACWDTNDGETKEREVAALAAASAEFGCANLLVITAAEESAQKIGSVNINFAPLHKWLLGNM